MCIWASNKIYSYCTVSRPAESRTTIVSLMRFGRYSQPLSTLTFEGKFSFVMPVFLAPKKYHYFSAPGALKDCMI